jgi:hypothetical protein
VFAVRAMILTTKYSISWPLGQEPTEVFFLGGGVVPIFNLVIDKLTSVEYALTCMLIVFLWIDVYKEQIATELR